MARRIPRGIKQPHLLGSVASRSGVSLLTVLDGGVTTSTGVKISELPVALAASDTDQMEVNQGGVSKRLTLDQVASLVGTELTDDYLPISGGTLTGPLTGTMATFDISSDHSAIVGVSGATKGIRLGTDATGGRIEGVDATLIGSFQPLYLGGTAITFGAPLTGVVTISGAGQTVANVSTSTGLGATVYARDSGALAGNGGMVMFGAGQGAFAAIKGLILDGSNNTRGDVAIATRRANTDATLTTTAQFSQDGGTTLFGALTGTSATFSGTVTAPGAQIQMVSFQTGAVATGTTVIPFDDTIPQITEGNEYMTLAITPKSATSKLVIEVIWNGGATVSATLAVALFQDSTANALAVSFGSIGGSGFTASMALRHTMTSGTTSATTFRVRAGMGGAGTTTFNGTGGGRSYGGVAASSIVIREVAP